MEISLAATTWFHIGPFPITDAILGAIIVSISLIAWGIWMARSFALVPTRSQLAMEMIGSYLLTSLEGAFGSAKEGRKYFAFLFTLLLYIAIANQFSLMPLVFEVTYGGLDVLRQPTSDFSGAIALSLITVGLAHVMALSISPIHHLKNFFPVHKIFGARSVQEFFFACIDFFIGILNIIGELAKVVSLSARLFGNMFAGNVMAAVIASLVPFVLPIPFIAISIFSGFVQAFVFMLLSMQFIAGTVEGARPPVSIVKV